MEFVPQQNRRCEGDVLPPREDILATGKRVVIIGGGDTGADCLGTVHRQKPVSVHRGRAPGARPQGWIDAGCRPVPEEAQE